MSTNDADLRPVEVYTGEADNTRVSRASTREIMEELTAYGMTGDKYQVESEIGRGGTATVYEAFDLGLKRKVVLKILLPEHKNDVEMLAR